MGDYLTLDISSADLKNLDALLKKMKEQNPDLDISVKYEEGGKKKETE